MSTRTNPSRGDVNPDNGLIYWGRKRWLNQEDFEKHTLQYKNLNKTLYENKYKKIYQDNREAKLLERKVRWKRYASDEPLKMLFYSARGGARNRKIDYKIKEIDIRNQFEKQNGKCFYTGLTMLIAWKTANPYQVSLDRVDSSLGYTVDNIVLCCQAINFAKSDYSKDVFMDFLTDISSQFRSSKQQSNNPEKNA